MFTRVLVANRGEIACRVISTCRRLGVHTVAVYSDADRAARHRFLSDEAIHLGGARAADSYLSADKVIETAKRTGADAIHPGYGFLSESASFARRCADEGIVFIGPSPEAIEAMGSKSAAKRIMESAGVPCVPGYHGDDQDDGTLTEEAGRIGFPLLIKATAGGGGKGMRIVRSAAGFADALAGARREAQAAFGDDRVLLERFIESPRHIEVQVFGDTHGQVVHLFERECSLQRRYQKIVEESPSPFVDEELRQRMGEAAVAAAHAVGYHNAGTVEFIVAPDGGFHFMEMNTRLQVEHPVTELVTGLDLVEWQLRVASGERLPAAQDDIRKSGHAFEVRIYAEDPDNDFVPATGRIRRFIHPAGPGVRVDTGVGDGDLIGPDYDPMIAKLCVYAADRADAVMMLRTVLARTLVTGLTTNLPLLRAVAAHDDFATGALDTGWIERELDALVSWPGTPSDAALDAAATAMAARWSADARAARPHDAGSPWTTAAVPEAVCFGAEDSRPEGRSHRSAPTAEQAESGSGSVIRDDGLAVVTAIDGDVLVVTDDDGRCWELGYQAPFAPKGGAVDDEAHPGAPMPGRIVAIHCEPGQRVSPGDPLLVLEAMKMEYTLQARVAGTVERVLYGVGDMVDAEVPLVDIHTEDA